MEWVVHATPRSLYPRERPGTHCIGGWVDPLDRSGRMRKFSSPLGFDPGTVQPVASRNADCASPAPIYDSNDANAKCLIFCLNKLFTLKF